MTFTDWFFGQSLVGSAVRAEHQPTSVRDNSELGQSSENLENLITSLQNHRDCRGRHAETIQPKSTNVRLAFLWLRWI